MIRSVLRAQLTILLCVALACVAWAAPQTYSFLSVTTNPLKMQLHGISHSGITVGFTGDGDIVPFHGFTLVLPNTFTPENSPMAPETQVNGINNNLSVTHGFTFNGSLSSTVDAPGTAFTQLQGINDSLAAVGYSSTDPFGMTQQRSFKESGRRFTYITGFPMLATQSDAAMGNNAGTVVGFYDDSSCQIHGYIATGTTASTFDVAGAIDTWGNRYPQPR